MPRGDSAIPPERTSAGLKWARVIAAVEAALAGAGAVVLLALVAIVFLAVSRRYLFGAGLVWSDELAIWLHCGLIALGLPLAASGALAMRLDILPRMLPREGRAVADIVADAVAVQALLVLAFGGSEVARLVGGTSTVLGLPEALRFAAFSAGGALGLLLLAARIGIARGLPGVLASLALGGVLYAAAQLDAGLLVARPSLVAGTVAAIALAAGAPLPFALIAGVSLSAPFGGLLPEPTIVQNAVSGLSKFLLLAVPFFLLAGELLTAGGLAERLVRFAAALVGHWRAGLAQTALLASLLFSGASGSSIANAAFGAKVMHPAMVARGYPPERAAAIVAGVSMLDNIVPPSIAFLLLASAANLSVGGLLVGGLIAGLILAAALSLGIHLSLRGSVEQAPRATAAERWRAFGSAWPALGLGVVIVVGMRFGLVTVTEASALAVAYALTVCILLRTLSPRGIARAFAKAAAEAAAVGLLIGASAPFAFLLAVDRVSEDMAALATFLGGGPFAVMLVANLVLLLAGLVLDIGAAILLMAPLLLPVAIAAGLDPVQFGVILVVNLMIHGLTPPLGILVYVVSGVTGVRAAAIFRAVLPLLGSLLAALAVMALAAAAWPSLRSP